MPYDRFGRFYEARQNATMPMPRAGYRYQKPDPRYPTPPPLPQEQLRAPSYLPMPDNVRPADSAYADLVGNLSRGRFRNFPGQPRYEDALSDVEVGRMERGGIIREAPPPIGPQVPMLYDNPGNPWSLQQPDWYELTDRGEGVRRATLPFEQRFIEDRESEGVFLNGMRPQDYAWSWTAPMILKGPGQEGFRQEQLEIPLMNAREQMPSRQIVPGGGPYEDREPPSVWRSGPGYKAPMYPEDFRQKAEPIPIAPDMQRIYPGRQPPRNLWMPNEEATQASNRAPRSNITITIGGTESGTDLENPANPLSQLINFWYPPQYRQQARQEPPPMQSQRTYMPMMRQGTNERITWPTGQPVPTNRPIPWSQIDNPWRVVEQIERQTGRAY